MCAGVRCPKGQRLKWQLRNHGLALVFKANKHRQHSQGKGLASSCMYPLMQMFSAYVFLTYRCILLKLYASASLVGFHVITLKCRALECATACPQRSARGGGVVDANS